MSNRPYEIALLGATGFTGQLVARYLAEHAPKEVRWVLAGRNERRLEEIRRSLEELACPPRAVVKADVGDEDSLVRMAADTSVVLTTVGPYALYGEPVARAAIEAGAHYVDITGEPDFVAGLITKYHDRAAAAGLKIVPCCGFDSIPADLGAQFTAEQLDPRGPISVRGYVRSRGTFSGGTWQSAIRGFARIRRPQDARLPRAKPAGGRTIGSGKRRIAWVKEVEAWAVPLPLIDPDIVLRSAAFCPEHGVSFDYAHFARVQRFGTLVTGGLAVGGLVALSQLKPTRELLLKVRTSGEGPSPEQRKKAWFEVTFVGEGSGKKVVTTVSGGDPGYGETSKMAAESALCLALDQKKLPIRAGILTPGSAMGKVLRERLIAAGIRFHVKSTS
jgi:short subunit dehydrogenase-like uncharacterized protein